MHQLPSLPYAYDALAAAIDPETLQLHHRKHHQTYVDKLNAGLADHPQLLDRSVEELVAAIDTLPEEVRTVVRNHGGGHANHSLLWTVLCPQTTPVSPALETALIEAFSSVADFKKQFETAAASVFGSGWAWLVSGDKGLEIMTTANQESPLMYGKTPLWGVDVWEHAYYLKYQNRRTDYLSALWLVMDGQAVSQRYQQSLQ